MNKLNSFFNSKYIKIILTIFVFVCYLISSVAPIWVNFVMYTIYGVIILLMLISSKNTSTALLFLLFEPFTICKVRFEGREFIQLISWFIPILFLIAGIIVNNIKYRPKLKIGKFTIGLAIYFIGLSLGGMFSKTNDAYTTLCYKWFFTPLLLIGFALIVYGIIFFTSTNKSNLDSLADDSLYLTLLIILQIIYFMIFNQKSPLECIHQKLIDLGWGIHNAVGMVILMCMPLSIYKAFKDLKKYWYYLIAYVVEFGIEVFLVCKGGILAAAIGSLVLVIGLIYFFKEYRKLILILVGCAIVVCLLGLGFLILKGFDFSIYLNLGTFFSRQYIWVSGLKVFVSNPIFGIGIIAPMGWNVSVTFPAYQYCHNTFVESLAVTGVIGLICLLYHLVEKYARVFYKMDFKKFIFFLFMLFPGLYGLIDNSYLEITYMLYFIYGLIVFENEIESNPTLKWLIHFKSSDTNTQTQELDQSKIEL